MAMLEPVVKKKKKKSPGLWPGILSFHLLFSEDSLAFRDSELSPGRISAIASVVK